MEHFIKLDRLPVGLEFPADLRDRISYAADKHRLVFQGFMAKYDYDRLARLHSDLDYLDALQHLFVLATYQKSKAAAPSKALHRMLIGGLAAAGLALATLLFLKWS